MYDADLYKLNILQLESFFLKTGKTYMLINTVIEQMEGCCWLCQLVGGKINKVAPGAPPNINRRTSPAAMYQMSVYGTSDNDGLSKDAARHEKDCELDYEWTKIAVPARVT